MNTRRRTGFVFTMLATACLGGLARHGRADTPRFQVGFAERDVSPRIGMEAPGGYGKSYHRAFHDPCKVRAAVFGDGKTRVAIVGIDALFIRGETVAAARRAIHDRCGIDPQAILISASHTHSGGPIGLFLPGEFDDAEPLVKKLVQDHTVIANPEYLRLVETGLVEAVVAADVAQVDARASAGFGRADTVAFNRRFRMNNGLTFTHPGQGNPEIVEPAGPIDPAVGVLGVWDREGKFLGCVVNYACHATTSPGGISADYIVYIERTIRSVMGDKAVVVFVPGAAGDVTQVDNRNPYQVKQSGEVSSRLVGGHVGAEALKALLTMEQGAGPLVPLDHRLSKVSIPRRAPSAEHLARARALVEKTPAEVGLTEWTFAKETVVLNTRIQREPVVSVELQAVQVGPAVFLSTPAEYFCQFGLDIKAGSPFPFTFPVSMANDAVGYVPTEAALSPGGGGYETRLTSYSNLVPTAGRKMADTLIELARGLKPGPAPRPAALPAFRGKPWEYGNLAPQID